MTADEQLDKLIERRNALQIIAENISEEVAKDSWDRSGFMNKMTRDEIAAYHKERIDQVTKHGLEPLTALAPSNPDYDNVVLMMRGQIAVSWERKARFWRRVSCCLAVALLVVAFYFLGTAL